MHLLRVVRIPVALGLAGLTYGCATSVPLSIQSTSAIQSVSVAKNVQMPEDSWWGYSCHATDMFASSECVGRAAHAMGINVRQMTSDLGRLTREQFAAEVRKAGIFRSVLAEQGEAEFELALTRIILANAGGYGGSVADFFRLWDVYKWWSKPVLVVRATLRKSDGSVLWQKSEAVDIWTTKTARRRFSEYSVSPELIRQDFTVAAQMVVQELVRDMVDKRR